MSAVAVPTLVSVTVWLALVPSETVPKLTLAGFEESVPVPEPPLGPEPPPEPEPDDPLAPLVTTPAQLESPIENTIRATVPRSVTSSRDTGRLANFGSDEDNSRWQNSPGVLIM